MTEDTKKRIIKIRNKIIKQESKEHYASMRNLAFVFNLSVSTIHDIVVKKKSIIKKK